MTVANTEPTSATFEVATRHGQQVAVHVSGSGNPVVLLNGLARPMASWSAFTPVLGERMIVSFDAPGVGASKTPKLSLSMQALSDVVADVLDAVGVARADVVGFSHGGAIAQQFAFSSPERVRRLALLSTSCGRGATPGSGKKAVGHYYRSAQSSSLGAGTYGRCALAGRGSSELVEYPPARIDLGADAGGVR
ncbi:alpha/beta fold hydrolase [Rhodococcus koreensis]|uniref:alpha/beta fold hydrolase n=1 Tax=Rhodococcus koreensis TaxID=99653 RepID=UPI00197E6FFE|nr:alpha/beta fold hydrolase [Rhodococcus koreensis]QSE82129.1 alpha/beta fold hydrolase [Rhodococcus koreensis]